MSIRIENINKHFETFTALDNINLTIPEGELVALLGPSGSGKTTLLRIIAGLEQADSGKIFFDQKEATHIHVRDRGVGFVFQNYALFKHMNVFENIAFGLRVRPKETRPSEEAIRKKVHELLELIRLDWIADRYPAQLSGGQRQRVALARALAIEPKVLLLDEPFGALDAKVRQELRKWLRELHNRVHITSIFVTHDQEEALEVSDKIVVMNQGKIEQIGTPEDVYDKPNTPFVYNFLGNVNHLQGECNQDRDYINHIAKTYHATYNEDSSLFVRPHEIKIDTVDDGASIKTSLLSYRLVGPIVKLELECNESKQIIEAQVSKEIWQKLQTQNTTVFFASFHNLRIFSKNGEWSDYCI